MSMQAPPGDQVGSDPDDPSASSKKGARHKVWDRMSWFRRRSRSKDNVGDSSGSSAVISPRVSANSEDPGSSLDGVDIDFSRETSTSSCSPVNSPSLLGSASSSESELYATQVDRHLSKRSRVYPNSEIVEQSCLRPSIARALFLQLESWMSNKNQAGTSNPKLNQKYTWPKKKRPCSSVVKGEADLEEASMTRAMSMPGGMLAQNKCHCAACCSCTHRERLEGRCPAYIKLTSSTTSLDTGLASLGLSLLYVPPQVQHEASASYDLSITSPDQSSLKTTTDSPKCNSLPTNPAQCTYKTCLSCNRYIPYVPQASNCDGAAIPPAASTSFGHSYFCLCQMDSSGDFKDRSKYSSQEASNETVSPASGVPSDTQLAKTQPVSTSPRVGPSEFKERTGVIKQWFSEFNDEQKNLILKQLLSESDLPQLHMLSLEMESRLHANCPPNCHDRVSWLPQTVALYIMSFLDPVSLCQASAVCRGWAQLAIEPSLWRYFCGQGKWRLSMAGEQKQFLHHMKPDGTIAWKEVFAEKYRLRNNWIKGKCNVRTFEGHHQGISCVQFDDTRIVSGSSDKTIKVWNIRTNNPWAVQTLVGHSGTVRCLHLDGNRLVSGSTDGTIKVWDLSTQQSWSSIACKVTMVGHTDTVRCLQVDEEKVISGSYDKTLKVWDMKNGVCRGTLRGHDAAVLCVQFDESKIVSGSCDKTIKVWKFDGTCMMTLEGHHDAVTCLQFDTSRIFSGSLDCNLKFWDIHTGECVNTIDWKASEGHTGVVRCLQADSWRVVSASDDRTLKVWSLETGQRLVTLRNHTDGVTCLQFNDSIIVSGSYDKTVKLWDFSCC